MCVTALWSRRCELRGCWLLALCALSVFSARVAAQPPTVEPKTPAQCGARPWVALGFDGDAWPARLQADFATDVRAELLRRDIDVCPADTTASSLPVARLLLHMNVADRVLVSIEVHDLVTGKRVLRDVDLHALAPDARGLSLAQAADELLRASWVELVIEDAPKPPRPAPPVVRRAVAQTARVAPESPVGNAIGARFATEHYMSGVSLLGADAFVEMSLLSQLGIAIALGLRSGLAVHAPNGSVDSSALTASADLFVPVLPFESRYNLRVSLGMHAADLSLSGHADGGAHGNERRALALVARGGVGGTVRVDRALRLALDVGAGWSLRSVSGFDTDRSNVVLSTRGLELHGSFGLGGLF